MNLWMDTAQTRWTSRHKQHIRQEACFFGNRDFLLLFITPRSPPVALRVAGVTAPADTDTPNEDTAV